MATKKKAKKAAKKTKKKAKKRKRQFLIFLKNASHNVMCERRFFYSNF